VPLERLPQEFQRRLVVTALADESFQNISFVIDGTPQVMRLAVDLHEHLVEMPLPVAEMSAACDAPTTDLGRNDRPEPVPPEAHAFVADLDAALVQHVLDVPQREREPDVEHHRLDIAKNVFQLHGVDGNGKVVLRRALRRGQLSGLFSTLPPCLIGMEACATAHHWARTLMAFGHEVRLIPPAYVKPYLRRQKNDAADAAAICEAVMRPSMRFVPVKSVQQQSTLMLHGARNLLVGQRTALINALRGHLAELGIVVAQGARNARQLIDWIQDEASPDIPLTARIALQPLAAMLVGIEAQIARLDKAILAAHRSDPISVRLSAIPGIGPIVASCLAASVPDAGLFRGGREFAAYLGLVPRQHSTGGKPRLGSISKMGNRHLRKLLVVGAHAALYSMKSGRTRTAVADWARRLLARKPFKVVAVALANKMARIAWAVMARSRAYEPAAMADAAQPV
jgi:transposase